MRAHMHIFWLLNKVPLRSFVCFACIMYSIGSNYILLPFINACKDNTTFNSCPLHQEWITSLSHD